MVVLTFSYNGLSWVLVQWADEYETILAWKEKLLIPIYGNYFCLFRALYMWESRSFDGLVSQLLFFSIRPIGPHERRWPVLLLHHSVRAVPSVSSAIRSWSRRRSNSWLDIRRKASLGEYEAKVQHGDRGLGRASVWLTHWFAFRAEISRWTEI